MGIVARVARQRDGREVEVTEQHPLPLLPAWAAVARCAATTVALLAHRRVHLQHHNLGRRLAFADGSSSWVYRETVVDRPPPADPAVLVVAFRLRGVRGRGHVWFRRESMLNTPLFVGFPGFVSKLWMTHDHHGVYRGVYQWDGLERAEAYAQALWRVLALVSVRGSIRYRVVPGMLRDDFLHARRQPGREGTADWWRVSEAARLVR